MTDLTRIVVKIQGLSPGLLFQGKGLMEIDRGEGKTTKPRPPEKEAELRAHWLGKGKGRQLCIPWVMLYQSICQAGAMFKYKGNKKLGGVIAATVACDSEGIPLVDCKGKPASYDVKEDWVRIPPKTGSMVKIGRPLIVDWVAEFVMVVDDELYDASQLEEVFKHAGKLVGIGAWRPGLKGPYGKFEVLEFKML